MHGTPRHDSQAWRLDTTTRDRIAELTGAPFDDPAAFARAADDAVDQAREVMRAGWDRWLAKHRVDPAPSLVCSRPTVTVVGDRADHLQVVAHVRFGFTAEGREFRGLARGPADAPVFTVEWVRDPTDAGGAGPRRRWFRRRRPHTP
ncbi:hypothetical protein ACXR2U_22230 [Jatrophihabitans sp. YIM 134969]